MPNTFFAIRVKPEEGTAVYRVLESQLQPPHSLSHGYHPLTAGGLPRLKSSTMVGAYPVAQIAFEDAALPVRVELEAFTPMIPLDPDDSGIPAAILSYRVTNTGVKRIEAVIAGSLMNPVGAFPTTDSETCIQI